LCISLLVVSLDDTVLNVALPDIVRSLHASSSDLQWVVDTYAVVFAGLLLVFGSLGDRLGRKWVLLGGLAVFGSSSAASAFATAPEGLIAARAVMGIGAAAIMPSTLSILTNVFVVPDERSRAIGIWSGTTGLGVAVGPVVGGWLLSRFWWGSVFLVNVPICLLAVAAVTALVPNSRDKSAKRPDALGAGLSTGGIALLLWGIIEAPTQGWSSLRVIATTCAGIIGLAGFVLWERHSDHPMLELSLFRSRRFAGAVSAMALVIFGLMGGLFLFTQYLQFALGFSALETGVRIAPIALVLMAVAPLSSVLDRRIGTKPVVATGMALVAVAFALLTSTSTASSYWQSFPAFLLMGIGVGLAFAPCTEAVMGSVALDKAGVGSATNSASLQIGGATGVAVLGSLLNARYKARMSRTLAPYHLTHSVTALIESSLGGALAVAERAPAHLGALLSSAARGAFVSGMDLAVVAATGVVGAAVFLVVAALPNRPKLPDDKGSLLAAGREQSGTAADHESARRS
jgi:EmrB/QacA subfamily drug resistance transporter